MTAPKPPTEAHDDQERELARILRALPAGEPSPELDARILRSAANASASSRKPHVRWFASAGGLWGIGAAAAAVLALGVSWQMLDPSRGYGERTSPVSVAQESDSAVVVELGETRRDAPQPMPGPPPANAPAPARVQDSGAPMAKAVAEAPRPAPAAPARASEPLSFPHDGLDEGVAARSEAAPKVSGIDVASVESTTILTAEQIGKVEARQRKAADANLAARDAAGSAREQSADVSGFAAPSATATGPMKPAAWLAQVRQLLAANRTEEARASLKLFHKRYPNYVVPADLAPLLRE
ncbi:MAG: hypothetical protein A3E01_13540 [Gammaproteobacteria bacterium RIFCSPHIGHO2_12_FULL_63_22]|nr:MAG: hypothetical protein A3E01_13540 [Gammaproteobacteria bacterium RIFCSPHIGHO2_12_FULL_63_22]